MSSTQSDILKFINTNKEKKKPTDKEEEMDIDLQIDNSRLESATRREREIGLFPSYLNIFSISKLLLCLPNTTMQNKRISLPCFVQFVVCEEQTAHERDGQGKASSHQSLTHPLSPESNLSVLPGGHSYHSLFPLISYLSQSLAFPKQQRARNKEGEYAWSPLNPTQPLPAVIHNSRIQTPTYSIDATLFLSSTLSSNQCKNHSFTLLRGFRSQSIHLNSPGQSSYYHVSEPTRAIASLIGLQHQCLAPSIAAVQDNHHLPSLQNSLGHCYKIYR